MTPIRKDPPSQLYVKQRGCNRANAEQRAVVRAQPGQWFLVWESHDNNDAYASVRAWKSKGFQVIQRRGQGLTDPIGVYAKWNG